VAYLSDRRNISEAAGEKNEGKSASISRCAKNQAFIVNIVAWRLSAGVMYEWRTLCGGAVILSNIDRAVPRRVKRMAMYIIRIAAL